MGCRPGTVWYWRGSNTPHTSSQQQQKQQTQQRGHHSSAHPVSRKGILTLLETVCVNNTLVTLVQPFNSITPNRHPLGESILIDCSAGTLEVPLEGDRASASGWVLPT